MSYLADNEDQIREETYSMMENNEAMSFMDVVDFQKILNLDIYNDCQNLSSFHYLNYKDMERLYRLSFTRAFTVLENRHDLSIKCDGEIEKHNQFLNPEQKEDLTNDLDIFILSAKLDACFQSRRKHTKLDNMPNLSPLSKSNFSLYQIL